MKQKLVLKISGQVQGINFRSMVKSKAIELGLTGFVKNLKDGSVTLEAVGDKEKLEELISWINQNPGASQINRLEDFWRQAENKYDDFSIEYSEI